MRSLLISRKTPDLETWYDQWFKIFMKLIICSAFPGIASDGHEQNISQ